MPGPGCYVLVALGIVRGASHMDTQPSPLLLSALCPGLTVMHSKTRPDIRMRRVLCCQVANMQSWASCRASISWVCLLTQGLCSSVRLGHAALFRAEEQAVHVGQLHLVVVCSAHTPAAAHTDRPLDVGQWCAQAACCCMSARCNPCNVRLAHEVCAAANGATETVTATAGTSSICQGDWACIGAWQRYCLGLTLLGRSHDE